MKKRIEKIIAIALTLGMVLSQPLPAAADEQVLPDDGTAETVIEETMEEPSEDEFTESEVAEEALAEEPVSDPEPSDELMILEDDHSEESPEIQDYQDEGTDMLLDEGNCNVADICLNHSYSSAIDKDGTLWTWGTPIQQNYKQPNPIRFSRMGEPLAVKSVSIGEYHSGDSGMVHGMAYITSSGELYADSWTSPLMENAEKVFYGNNRDIYIAATDADKNLWIWGYETIGNGGSGTRPDISAPTKLMEGTGFKDACFGSHNAVIDTDGNLWTWGENNHGQLGDGTEDNRTEPAKILEGTAFEKVSLGSFHSAAIDTDGNLWTWGYNLRGQLGDCTTESRSAPAKIIEGTRFKDVSLGNSFSAAIDTDGNLWTWGYNSDGELGDGTTENRSVPVKIMNGHSFSKVSLGWSHGAAIDINGDLWTWGNNRDGQLGDGTYENHTTPVMVTIPEASPSTKYTVRFDSKGGSAVASQKVEPDGSAKKPANPTRNCYRFDGWYKDEECTQRWDFKTDRVTEELTVLYAKWVELGTLGLTNEIWSFGNYVEAPLPVTSKMLSKIMDCADGKLDGALDKEQRLTREKILNEFKTNELRGNCFGFATSVISDKKGYDDIAPDLYEVPEEEGKPVISGYHLLQKYTAYTEEVKKFMNLSLGNQLLLLYSPIAGYSYSGPELLVYGKDGWGGHAVAVYGVESGEYVLSQTTGNTYDRRLRIYDCNAVDTDGSYRTSDPNDADYDYSDDFSLYINTDTKDWEVPAYNDSERGPIVGGDPSGGQVMAEIYCVTALKSVICPIAVSETDDGDSLAGDGDHEVIYEISVNSPEPLRIESGSWNAVISRNGTVSSSDELATFYDCGYRIGQTTTPPLNVFLPDDLNGNITITPQSGEKGEIDISLTRGDHFVRIKADRAETVMIKGDGSYDVIGNSGTVDAKIVSALMPEGQYDAFELSGQSTGNISLNLNPEGGATVTGDDLSGLRIVESDERTEKEVQVLPEQTEVRLGGENDTPEPRDPDVPDDAPDGIWIKGLKSSYPYTGSAVKPEFKVYRGTTRLYEKTDYTLTYAANTKPGNASVTIRMKGNYSGAKTIGFSIEPASLKTDIAAEPVYVAYKKNKKQTPKPVLLINGTKLKYGNNDLVFTYPSKAAGNKVPYIDPGRYKIHIAPKNASMFKDETDVDLVIADAPLMSAVTVRADKTSIPYDNGNPLSPVFTLTYKNNKLIEGTDYTVRYEDDHSDIGKHTVTFVGNEKDCFGTKSFVFSITGKYDLGSDMAEVKADPAGLDQDGSAPYTNGGAKPGASVKFGGVKLAEGKDYSVTYKGNTSLGNATMTVKGKGNYSGTVVRTFPVKERNINTFSMQLTDVLYSSRADAYKKTTVTFTDRSGTAQKLKNGTDYSVEFDGDNGTAPAAGTEIKVTVTGKGNYSGTINGSYRIIEKDHDLTKATAVVNGGRAYDYTGREIKPAKSELKVTLKGRELNPDDYEILGYFNNVNKGNNACVRLRGKNEYAGIKDVKFKIGTTSIDKVWSSVILNLRNIFTR